MMSASPSPIHPGYNNSSNNDKGERTSLMQSNYLVSSENSNNSWTNTRRRPAAMAMQQDPYSTTMPSHSASFSPPYLPIIQDYSPDSHFNDSKRGSFEDDNDKERTGNYSTNNYAKIISTCSKYVKDCCCRNDEDTHPSHLYYQDNFNDSSWSWCTFGTSEDAGVWMNTQDQAGSILAFTVWFLLGYSAITMTFLAQTGGIPSSLSFLYQIFAVLALASHAKTTFTDPGAIPQAAVPRQQLIATSTNTATTTHSMCSQCQTYKPPFSHHCRICNRCISRMDHHCPWMNNCIGSGNLKHFILFLIYMWICSALALALLGWNYFVCNDEECEFTSVLVQLVRVMTVICTASFLFTSSMIMNVWYGIMTGIGTIDRLKKKANATMMESDEEPLEWVDIFGIGPYYTWVLPVDPIFEDYDRVMGYSTPQRLLREQLREDNPFTFINATNDKQPQQFMV